MVVLKVRDEVVLPTLGVPMTVSDGVTGGSGSGWSDRLRGLHPSIERFSASIGFDITLLQQDLDGSRPTPACWAVAS